MAVHVIIPGTFLCRPPQNSIVKGLNSAFFGEREPQQAFVASFKIRQTH